jgi:hypothetical protein
MSENERNNSIEHKCIYVYTVRRNGPIYLDHTHKNPTNRDVKRTYRSPHPQTPNKIHQCTDITAVSAQHNQTNLQSPGLLLGVVMVRVFLLCVSRLVFGAAAATAVVVVVVGAAVGRFRTKCWNVIYINVHRWIHIKNGS